MKLDGDCPLHVEIQGEGPPVLLAHGFGGSARNFRPQARALGARHRVVLFDARGHARSAAPDDPLAYAPECFIADLGRILDGVGVSQSVIGGLSMGAAVALGFALAQPERVRGLVLAAFPPGARSPEHAAWAHDFAAAIEGEGLDAAGARFVWGARSGFDAQAARWIRLGFLEHSPHALAHMLRQLIATLPPPEALAPRLRALRIPTLVIVGSEDRLSRRSCETLAAELPQARLVVVEGASHVVNLAAPEVFNRELGDFLVGPEPYTAGER